MASRTAVTARAKKKVGLVFPYRFHQPVCTCTSDEVLEEVLEMEVQVALVLLLRALVLRGTKEMGDPEA